MGGGGQSMGMKQGDNKLVGECEGGEQDLGLRWWNLPLGEVRILLLKGQRKPDAGEARRLGGVVVAGGPTVPGLPPRFAGFPS